MKRVWMATVTLGCVLMIGACLAGGCIAQCCESKPGAPPAENKAKQVFMKEVPAQLKAQIDEKISEVRKKKPLSDEEAAKIREAVKKGGRTDAKGNPNDAMITVSSAGLAGLPVIADCLVSEDDTLRL